MNQPVKTHTEHDKSIPALIDLLKPNENYSKIVGYLYFLGGLGQRTFLKITKKFTSFVPTVRKITNSTIIKHVFPYLEF